MRAAHAGSLLNNSSPSLALSSRPTGASHGSAASAKQLYTVARPFSSLTVVTKPRGFVQHENHAHRRRGLLAVDIDPVETLPHRKFGVVDHTAVDADPPLAHPTARPECASHA